MSDGEAADFFFCRLLLLASRFPRALDSLVCLAALTFFGSVPRERLVRPRPLSPHLHRLFNSLISPPSSTYCYFLQYFILTVTWIASLINREETNNEGSYVVGCVFLSLIFPMISHTGNADAKVIRHLSHLD